MKNWSINRQIKGITALLLAVSLVLPQNIATFAEESDGQIGTIDSQTGEKNSEDSLTDKENNAESAISEKVIKDEPACEEIAENLEAVEQLERELMMNDKTANPEESEENKSSTIYTISDEGIANIVSEGNIADSAIAADMTAEDEAARKTDGDAFNRDTKICQYLKTKYKTQMDTNGDGTVSDGELESAYNTYSGIIEICGPNAAASTDSAALKEITHNMVQYNMLGSFKNVKEIVIDGVDEIRDIYLPVSLEKLTIKNSTLNISKGSGFYHYGYSACAGLFNCPNLEELTLENDTLGTMYLRQNVPGWVFLNELTLPLYNNTQLKKLEVSINFVNDEQKLIINAGSDAFSQLTEENCNIVTSGDGRLIVESSNTDSAFSKKYTVVEGVEFESRLFKEIILGDTNADENGDGILTQTELNSIESLIIDGDHLPNTWPNLDTCTIFNDLEKLQGLKELTIQQDYSDHTARLINAIKFPASLEKLTIINSRVKFTDSQIPSVKTLVLRNVQPINVSADAAINLTVNDTGGNLENVCLDDSGITSFTVINGGTKRNLTISAEEATILNKVEFKGASYTLVGENSFVGCTKLNYIGSGSAPSTLDCSAGDTDFYLNFTNCTSLAGNSNSMVINCAVPGESPKATIALYSTNNLFENRLTINRTGAGTVTLLVDDDTNLSKWSTKYTQGNGFKVSAVSSDPEIAVFNLGNLLNLNSDGYVDRWNIVVQKGTNFRNYFKYYVVENGKARRIIKLPTGRSVRFDIENPDDKTVIKFHNNASEPHDIDAVSAGIGRVVVKLIDTSNNSVIREIGSVSVRVTEPTSGVMPKVISPIDSSYTLLPEDNSEDNPIYVEGNGRIAFKASMEPGDDITFQDALWFLNSKIDGGYSKFRTASSQGIKVSSENDYSSSSAGTLSGEQISNSKTDNTIREFYFPGSLSGDERKLKLTIQAPIKSNGMDVNRSWYIQIKDPCDISLSNEGKIEYGVSGKESVIATISGIKNKNTAKVSLKNIDNYNGCISFNKLSENDSSITYKIMINREKSDSDIKGVFNSNAGVILQVKADYGYQEKIIDFVNNMFYITYELDGGNNNSGNPDSYVAGAGTITLLNPTRNGYVFEGWYLNGEKVTTIDTNVTGNITLVAKWKKVSGDSDQGDPVPGNVPDSQENENEQDKSNVNSEAGESQTNEDSGTRNSYSNNAYTNKSEKPVGTLDVSTDGQGKSFMDMIVHFLDAKTVNNQLFLANLNLNKLKAKKIKVIETFGVYPRRKLSVSEDGTKQKMVYKLPQKMPVNSVIYAQCYSVKDGAYTITGIVTANGYAVFNDYILRDEVNVTIFTVE